MTSQEFVQAANTASLPWNTYGNFNVNKPWTDSAKEQYFSMLNAEAANEHELEMWRLNNEYNTPEKQMERLVAAGINPAAAYQNITSGNASSAPGVHESKTPAWHDQADKLAKVNTILGGIRDIMSTVGQGVQAAQGIQSMALTHQNNWYDKMRSDYFKNGFAPWLGTSKEDFTHPVQIAPGLFGDATQMQFFPEFYTALKDSWKGGTYDLGILARQDQHSLVERRNRIDGLIQKIFEGLENNASTSEMIRLFMELLAYTTVQNYGGGF